ncbi:hypothetical protein G7067_03120 [Leucobacter insecticola]|uniref:DUF3322 and DUF2220 domain-containing protein n=1 Tax=Leucobacter insecticola TaxID=2714934 RepID=A0A6G8FH05_9MICO|nr:Wadjet anti-phage system protein JetD domain-containing protein [Leucobacter insecticola]QIM15634.1 hypothetical protein G7067_03120 [Leucobacter insecticola]
MTWTTAADLGVALHRRWKTGAMLRSHALAEPFEPISLPIKGPSERDLAERLAEVRRWAAALERAADGGKNFEIVLRGVGGRHLGRSEVPARAVFTSRAQLWRALGVGGAAGAVARFDDMLAAAALVPAARDWLLQHPIRALDIADDWPAILAARDWLDWHRDSGLFLRQIDAPGVDTKLIERNRGTLAALLGVSASAAGFVTELGFAEKPGRVRLRFDPAALALPAALTEAELRVSELAELNAAVTEVLIVENEVTYLSVPVPSGAVVFFGRGYDAAQAASIGWLRRAAEAGQVRYWGDLDTHGFQILHRLRQHLPGVRSVLMDRDTLLAHESRWGEEPTPTRAELSGLTDAEAALYEDLVTDRYGRAVRLEQERIDWAWVMVRLG